MHVFQRFPASHHQCSLIPFGAIILSQLLNGRDSIIPSNRTQSSWLANLRESPPGPQLSGPCQNKCLKMWHYGCRAWNGWSQGRIVYRSDVKGGHSAEYCCRQKQTVVKIPPLFRCLVLSHLFSVDPLYRPHCQAAQLKTLNFTLKTPHSNHTATFGRVLLPVVVFFCVYCFSIIKTKGTRGRCGGVWAQLCSASCLTGGSMPEEMEWGGGERGRSLLLTSLHLSEDLDSEWHC